MSPSSLSLDLRNTQINLGRDTRGNPTVKDKQLCQRQMIKPFWHCPQEILSSNFIKHSKVDLTKATCLQLIILCDHSHHLCVTWRNQTLHLHRLILSTYFKNNLQHFTSEESRGIVQHGMAMHVNNPPEHNEPQHDHIEPQNDSGYGSGGLPPSVMFDSRSDLDKLMKNYQELIQSCFYYGSIDSQISRNLLRKKPTGTFLIRDSADPRYLYSLSVKTEKGATSIRILYKNGLFQFDSDERIRHKLPQFNSVLALLDFHVKVTEKGGNKLWRWEEISGCQSLMVDLKTPLKKSVASLAHLSRVKINKSLENVEFPQLSIDRLPLDLAEVKEFIREYPYRI